MQNKHLAIGISVLYSIISRISVLFLDHLCLDYGKTASSPICIIRMILYMAWLLKCLEGPLPKWRAGSAGWSGAATTRVVTMATQRSCNFLSQNNRLLSNYYNRHVDR